MGTEKDDPYGRGGSRRGLTEAWAGVWSGVWVRVHALITVP